MSPIIRPRTVPENQFIAPSLDPLLNRIYLARGITNEKELDKSLSELCQYNYFLNINKAIDVLIKGLNEDKHILIVGDFDADGATSTALSIKALKAFGLSKVSYLVPNRFEYGYGLTPEIVDVAAEQKPDLIMTVDNGISSCDGVDRANAKDIPVLITDHHLPGDILPKAAAIINPNQVGDQFPSKSLAGVGVVFYLMLALRAKLREINWFKTKDLPDVNMVQFLDLVALGTVADVVPLDKNNRILVQRGIQQIRQRKACLGIEALLSIARRDISRLVSSDLGFAVAPRLNAAGRLEDMSIGIECLLAEDFDKANALAVQLDELNRERQNIEADMHQQAANILDQVDLTNDLPTGVCLYHPNWHQGVVGIVASRVKEQTHKPVIVFSKVSENELKGSARSIAGLHIRDVLASIDAQKPNLITKFGGHAMAAGLSLPLSRYDEFKLVFDHAVREAIGEKEIQEEILTDGELSASAFLLSTAELIREAEPWGQHFPEPVFDNEFLLVDQRIVGEKHLKMKLSLPDTKKYIDAIAFRVDLKQWPNYSCKRVRAVYRLDINEYQGNRRLQLIVEYLEKIPTRI